MDVSLSSLPEIVASSWRACFAGAVVFATVFGCGQRLYSSSVCLYSLVYPRPGDGVVFRRCGKTLSHVVC